MRLIFCFLILQVPVLLFGQTTLRGTVIDADTKELLPFANVSVDGGSVGTSTDIDGNYELNLADGPHTIVFSYVGYLTIEKEVNLNGGESTLDVALMISQTLKEIEVTADIAIDRKTPVAFTNISSKQLVEELAAQDVVMVLNSVPGAYATQTGGGDGDARVNIRGFNSRSVAVMLDGVPVNDMENGNVFWSNWFGLDLVTKTIQVQRGLGHSKLVIPSIGGTVNILTKGINDKRAFKFKQEVGDHGFLRSTLGINTGRMKGGWGLSTALSYKQGNGWVDGAFTKGYFYYLRVDKELGDHMISLSGFGAPQQHGQRSFKSSIAYTDSSYASALDVPEDAIANELVINQGRQFNQHLGVFEGKPFNTRQNYYHKPQISLRHSWQPNNRFFWSNVAYVSIGNGGGVSDEGPGRFPRNEDGLIDVDSVVNFNTAISIFKPEGLSEYILKSRVNNHYWYGLLSTVSYEINEFFSFSGGMDLRSYRGDHYTAVYDLLGGEYFKSNGNSRIDEPEAKLRVGDKFDGNNSGFVRWGGAFGVVEYEKNNLTTFFNLSGAGIGYKLEDYMKPKVVELADTTLYVGFEAPAFDKEGNEYTLDSPEAKNQQTEWIWQPNLIIKTGGAYRISRNHSVFVNAGYLSRAATFYNVIQNNRFNSNPVKVIDDYKNEEVLAGEVGYSYKSPKFAANANFYYLNWNNKPLRRVPTVLRDPSDPESERLPVNINGISARHAGFEFDFKYKILKSLELEGLLSLGDWIWNSSSVVQLPDGTNYEFDAKGVHVGDAAQTQYGASIRYEPIKRLYFKVKGVYFGKNFSNFNPEDLKGDSGGMESWQMPDYLTVNAHMGYGFKLNKLKFNFRLNVLNVFDNQYIADAQNNDRFTQQFNEFDAKSASVFFGLGRRFTTSLSLTF